MAAWRYEISLLFSKFRIATRPCNIVYLRSCVGIKVECVVDKGQCEVDLGST